MGQLFLRVFAILAVAGYLARIGIDCFPHQGNLSTTWSRTAWTWGFLLLVLHVVCAFHWQHGWSHAAAWEHTRHRTLELTGWDSGAGLYFNEMMTAVWLMDTVAWWLWRDWPRRQRGWYWAVQLFFAFMTINATVVFGPWYWTVVVIAFLGGLIGARSAVRRG